MRWLVVVFVLVAATLGVWVLVGETSPSSRPDAVGREQQSKPHKTEPSSPREADVEGESAALTEEEQKLLVGIQGLAPTGRSLFIKKVAKLGRVHAEMVPILQKIAREKPSSDAHLAMTILFRSGIDRTYLAVLVERAANETFGVPEYFLGLLFPQRSAAMIEAWRVQHRPGMPGPVVSALQELLTSAEASPASFDAALLVCAKRFGRSADREQLIDIGFLVRKPSAELQQFLLQEVRAPQGPISSHRVFAISKIPPTSDTEYLDALLAHVTYRHVEREALSTLLLWYGELGVFAASRASDLLDLLEAGKVDVQHGLRTLAGMSCDDGALFRRLNGRSGPGVQRTLYSFRCAESRRLIRDTLRDANAKTIETVAGAVTDPKLVPDLSRTYVDSLGDASGANSRKALVLALAHLDPALEHPETRAALLAGAQVEDAAECASVCLQLQHFEEVPPRIVRALARHVENQTSCREVAFKGLCDSIVLRNLRSLPPVIVNVAQGKLDPSLRRTKHFRVYNRGSAIYAVIVVTPDTLESRAIYLAALRTDAMHLRWQGLRGFTQVKEFTAEEAEEINRCFKVPKLRGMYWKVAPRLPK